MVSDLSLPGDMCCLVKFSNGSELTSLFLSFLCACFNPEAIAGILIAHTPGLLYLILCIFCFKIISCTVPMCSLTKATKWFKI